MTTTEPDEYDDNATCDTCGFEWGTHRPPCTGDELEADDAGDQDARDLAITKAIGAMTDHQRRRALWWISGADLPLTETAIRITLDDQELDELIDFTERACTPAPTEPENLWQLIQRAQREGEQR